MANYTITITNNSPVRKTFFIFGEKPKSNSDPSTIFQCVLLSDTAASFVDTSFVLRREIYGVCGKTLLQNGATAGVTDSAEVQLGTAESKGTTLQSLVRNGEMKFRRPFPPASAGEGAFDIMTGTDFDEGDPYFVGMAVRDGGGEVRVASILQAIPNSMYTFAYPGVFYITTGIYTPGTIIDVTTLGVVKQVRFDGNRTDVQVTYNPNGTFT